MLRSLTFDQRFLGIVSLLILVAGGRSPGQETGDQAFRRGFNALVSGRLDERIRYKPNELAAVRRHRVALLVVVGKAPFPVLARRLRRHHAEDLVLPRQARGSLHRQGIPPLIC